jgi:hypothetical protein
VTGPTGDPAGAPAAGPAGGLFAVAVTVRLASAGLHVIDRWTDSLLDALQEVGVGEPQVGGSLTGGRIEVYCTVAAADVPEAAAVAAELLRRALTGAATPGVTVVGLAWNVAPDLSSAGPAPS